MSSLNCLRSVRPQVILGQGYPAVPSRFLDPRDPKNNAWRPKSVPSVRAQPWWWNYRHGLCGVRKLDDDMSADDPLLEEDFSNPSLSPTGSSGASGGVDGVGSDPPTGAPSSTPSPSATHTPSLTPSGTTTTPPTTTTPAAAATKIRQKQQPLKAPVGSTIGLNRDEGCSVIADNPLHGTPADLLVGAETAVEVRRSKFVAVSRLSDVSFSLPPSIFHLFFSFFFSRFASYFLEVCVTVYSHFSL